MNIIGFQKAIAAFILGIIAWGIIFRIGRDNKATEEDDKMSCMVVIGISFIGALVTLLICYFEN